MKFLLFNYIISIIIYILIIKNVLIKNKKCQKNDFSQNLRIFYQNAEILVRWNF
jgi:hypothetical protein